MQPSQRSTFFTALTDSVPALFGYLPLGMAFGLVSYKSLHNIWIGPLISLCVYAAAAQYMSLSIMAAKGSLTELAATTFVLNLRHVFYGIPFLNHFKKRFWQKLYFIFGITDETYALLTVSPHQQNEKYCLWLSFFTHGYWVLGTLLGSVLGSQLNVDLSALDFTLTALFVILTIEQGHAIKKAQPFVIGLLSFGLALLISPTYLLAVAMSLSAGLLLLTYRWNNPT